MWLYYWPYHGLANNNKHIGDTTIYLITVVAIRLVEHIIHGLGGHPPGQAHKQAPHSCLNQDMPSVSKCTLKAQGYLFLEHVKKIRDKKICIQKKERFKGLRFSSVLVPSLSWLEVVEHLRSLKKINNYITAKVPIKILCPDYLSQQYCYTENLLHIKKCKAFFFLLSVTSNVMYFLSLFIETFSCTLHYFKVRTNGLRLKLWYFVSFISSKSWIWIKIHITLVYILTWLESEWVLSVEELQFSLM